MGKYSTVLRTFFAESKPRRVDELKKKWNNLKRAAMKDIRLYANSVKGAGKYFKTILFSVCAFCLHPVGGGPAFKLKPLYEKLHIHVFKKDNPSLPGEIIPVSCRNCSCVNTKCIH